MEIAAGIIALVGLLAVALRRWVSLFDAWTDLQQKRKGERSQNLIQPTRPRSGRRAVRAGRRAVRESGSRPARGSPMVVADVGRGDSFMDAATVYIKLTPNGSG